MTAPPPPAGYVIEAPLGRGATGTVHRARRADWAGRLVALKRLPHADERTAGLLRREAEVLAALDHPHIVRVFDLVDDGAGVAIAMQLAAGGSLADLLDRRGALDPAEVVFTGAAVADALASAHRHGVLHCDVKPANVLFTSDGEPLLSDFGVARRLGPDGRPDGHDGGGVTGTAEYLDPEVAAGAPADGRSDVYALGAVCYEMLAGRPPFTGTTPAEVLGAAARGRRAPVQALAPATPAALAEAVERALARRPEHRFADAAAFGAALRAAGPGVRPDLGGPSADARRTEPRPLTRAFGPRPPLPPAPPRARVRRPRGRTVAAGVAVAVGAVLVAAGAGAALRPSPAPAAAGAPATVPARPRACPPAPGPLRADLDGDGCESSVTWDAERTVLVAEGRRYQLGRPGDIVVLGDWDCDGRVTPALYRPGTGQVFVFAAWAPEGAALPATEAPGIAAGGVPAVRRGAGGCDRVVAEAPVAPPPA